MDPITAKLMSAAGVAADRVYVDDVFSIDLYEGTGAAQTITNGIDLSGEGGMVWAKSRTSSRNHIISDTERGTGKVVFTNLDSAQDADSTTITSYNSNGFTMGTSTLKMNTDDEDFCSWTFRKCPGFFDVVTYTGTGSAQNISHNLGSVPGSIWIKCTSQDENWSVFHRSLGATHGITLNSGGAAVDADGFFNDTAPTSSVFTVGTSTKVNGNGLTFVAYLFAHDDQSFGDDGDEAIIKCGTYTGNGGSQLIDVGFEPQWMIVKRTSGSSIDNSWYLMDSMRGWFAPGSDRTQRVLIDRNIAEDNDSQIFLASSGLQYGSSANFDSHNGNGNTYIYMAIRRPHKPPSAATDVFAIDNKSGASGNTPQFTSNFPVDFALQRNNVNSAIGPTLRNRHANEYIATHDADARIADTTMYLDFNYNNGYGGSTSSDSNDYMYMFRRAPGFADLVFYDGDGNNSRSINHNLGVAPELVIVKNRFNTSSGSSYWVVHSTQITASQYLRLDENQAVGAGGVDSYPTASAFPVSDSNSVFNTLNKSGDSYVAYLFASVSGICKIGKYTGAGGSTDVDVDCGFTNGAKLVIIKKTNGVGDWNLFDTDRGINSGTEKYFTLNNSFAPYEFDVIDPLSSGFTVVNETAASQGFNVSGDTYLFIAIA